VRRSLCAPCQKKSSGFAQISEKGGITFEWNRGTRTNHTSCTRALYRSLTDASDATIHSDEWMGNAIATRGRTWNLRDTVVHETRWNENDARMERRKAIVWWQPVSARQGEIQLRGVQPLPPRQAETQLRGLHPLPPRQAERQLRGVQPTAS
jgi:hypothetical protein